MSVRLTLLCHAATSAVREAAFPLDEALDPLGSEKAAALDVRRVDSAWTSPALRARQTADALGLSAVIEPALRDIDLGGWAGRSFAEVHATEPDALARWTADPAAAPHGGESVVALLTRVAPWLAAIGDAEGRHFAVTHAAILRAALVLALDASPRAFWRIDIAPLARLRLNGAGGRWTLRSLS